MSKILFISNLYPPLHVGGYEIIAYQIANGLKTYDKNVQILTSNYSKTGLRGENEVIRKLKILPFRSHKENLARKIASYYIWIYNFIYTLFIIKKMEPDLIVIWSLRNISISPLYSSRLSQKPIVLCLHSYWFLPEIRFAQKQKIKNVIFNSIIVKQRYNDAGFQPQNFDVIYNGIELNKIKRRRDNKIKKMLYVGRLSPEKGLETLIAAFSLLDFKKYPDLILSIAGSGDPAYTSFLQSKIKPQLKERIKFLGNVDHNQIWDVYDSHDLLIVPSIWTEPFGLIIIEAMARGTITLASNSGGPKEIINDGQNGFLVETGRPDLMKLKIESILNNPRLRKIIRENAYQTISSKFLLSSTIDKYNQFFTNTIG